MHKMARPKMDGLLYFPFDTDFFYADNKIRALRSRYGCDGLVMYIYLLTEIYRKGYFIKWDEDSEDDIIAVLNLSEGLIKQVITFLVSRSLLTSILVNSDTVLTSPGIQKRYQEAVKGLKRDIFVDEDIWLLGTTETAAHIKFTKKNSNSGKNDDKSEKNRSKSVINDTNEIKGNESKGKEKKEKKKEPAVYFNEESLNCAFSDYVSARKEMKKPMTERAINLAIKKLYELAGSSSGNMDNDKAIRILQQSVMNGWTGLFPLREIKKPPEGGIDWSRV